MISTFGGEVSWSFVSQFEVVEGILISLMLLSICIVADHGFLFDTPFLSVHLKSPLSHLCTALAVLGAASFDLLVLCNMEQLNRVLDVNGWDLVRYPLSLFSYRGGSAMGQGGLDGYGALALVVWGLTVVAFSLAGGFKRAVKLFALPSILFLTVVVLLFDPGEMDSQAINLVSGVTFRGISLLSNWSLLTVSLFSIVFSLAYGVLGSRKSSDWGGLGRPLLGRNVRAIRRRRSPTAR